MNKRGKLATTSVAKPQPRAQTTNSVAPAIMTGMRPNRSAKRPARKAPSAHPRRAMATVNPVRAAESENSSRIASSAPLITDESKPNRKPPIAPAMASTMTRRFVCVDMGASVAEREG